MLSICIPVYNTNIIPLVQSLRSQGEQCGIPFEILCLDDASSPLIQELNQAVRLYPEVTYEVLEQNAGRAAIRNLLAERARYPYLLLLDDDVAPATPDFIQKYVQAISPSYPVIVGGRVYPSIEVKKEVGLHFRYGKQREVIPAEIRKTRPYASFVTGNFLIQKKIFERIQFLPSLTEYGHEDTLFGLELKKHQIPVLHIDNPVIHEGLETNEVFIRKQLTAVRNLALLIGEEHDMSSILLYRVYLKLKKYYLLAGFRLGFGLLSPILKKLLESGLTTSLILFDALRLYQFSMSMKKSEKLR